MFTDTITSDFAKVLALHGTTITINHVTSEVVNEEGDVTPTYSQSSGTALSGRLDYETRKLIAEGLIHAGTLKLFVTAATTVDVGDKITLNAKDWTVTSVTETANLDTKVFQHLLIAPTK